MIRNTVQRTLVLDTVRHMTNHPTADEVYDTVLPRCPGISKSTVYRILGNLSEEGDILRVEIPNAPDRFDFTLKPHAHCLCRICKKVFDFPVGSVDISQNSDFIVEKVNIVVNGICKECSAKNKS